ncbi:MAG TPA: endonuclease/exonuclease/phosphatase family protein [Tepidisphaeraceae bacterium]|nr:endonuclease/exonuclease/phosphatase family protein [Tepidisphaeraceae bacterium]
MLSYNILDGGAGRAPKLADVIASQRPDIVALVEADDASVVEQIAGDLNMDFLHARAGRKGSAILSRWNIRQTIDHAALRDENLKSLLEATIVDPSGREWIVGIVHLAAHAREKDEQKRERQIELVLDIFSEYRKTNRPHLLAGDFNSNSPIQQIDPQQCKPETRQEWQANGGGIPRRVVQKILDADYIDTLAAFDLPQAKTNGSFSTDFPGQRVDYIFAFGIEAPKIKQAWIEKSPLAKEASDHFPIGAEIIDE